MPFKKDDPNINRNGKPKGPNKVTREVRKAYQKLTEDNLENMSVWLNQVAADNPEKAMDLMLRLSEYVIPKLARTEVTGQDGEDFFRGISFNFGPSINDKDNRQQDETL